MGTLRTMTVPVSSDEYQMLDMALRRKYFSSLLFIFSLLGRTADSAATIMLYTYLLGSNAAVAKYKNSLASS